jgi:transketolase
MTAPATAARGHVARARVATGWPGAAARSVTEKKPRVIICDTKMAKGVPFLETREKSHFLRVERDEWQPAIEALGAGRIA